MNPTPAKPTVRRHDLDALRAFAMLLGIALHAGMSFIPLPMWPVQDARQNPLYGLFFAAIHGFRMPLFFLVSGFFTAMLWRKRGVAALLRHRAKRILLPCLLGLVTIVPLTNLAFDQAMQGGSEQSGLVAAIRQGDSQRVALLLSEAPSDDAVDEDTPPLTWAALVGDADIARLLIESGAEVNAQGKDGGTALHAAMFLGHAEVAKLLLDHGADVTIANNEGHAPAAGLDADWALTVMVAHWLELPLGDQEELEQGRREIRAMLEERGLAEPTASAEEVDETQPFDPVSAYRGFISSGVFNVEFGAWTFNLIHTPVFNHLWFLWFLCWLVPMFVVAAWLVDRLRIKRPSPLLVATPVRYLWLVPLTLVPQWFMGAAAPTFGPDTSVGLLPQPHLLFYYAIFFFFGAIYYCVDDERGRLGKWWWLTLPFVAAPAFLVGLVALNPEETFPGSHALGAAAQVVYVWVMSFALMGFFRRCLPRESATVRYISDSSYWLYVAHLPLVIYAQMLIVDWQAPSIVKLALLCVAVTAILLASYDWLVRYTWLGTMLNGPRTRPSRTQETAIAEAT